MKKLLALALALAMSLSLVACGGSSSSAPAGDGADTSTASSLSQAVAATGEKVKLGIIIWGTTDALGRNSTMMVEKLVSRRAARWLSIPAIPLPRPRSSLQKT